MTEVGLSRMINEFYLQEFEKVITSLVEAATNYGKRSHAQSEASLQDPSYEYMQRLEADELDALKKMQAAQVKAIAYVKEVENIDTKRLKDLAAIQQSSLMSKYARKQSRSAKAYQDLLNVVKRLKEQSKLDHEHAKRMRAAADADQVTIAKLTDLIKSNKQQLGENEDDWIERIREGGETE